MSSDVRETSSPFPAELSPDDLVSLTGTQSVLDTPVASADVFISYNRRDTGATDTLANALRERGLSIFLDRWSLAPGSTWPEELQKALAVARAVIVVIGPNGLSAGQRLERDLALARELRGEAVRIVPVLIPGGDPPLDFLGLKNWVDLSAGVENSVLLDGLVGVLRGETPSVALSICPYRGLRPFREEDAPFFFGRDAFVERAAAAVRARHLTAVVGASGSGKSSAVRAGVFPRLRSDALQDWEVVAMRPGAEPFHALVANLETLLEPSANETDRLTRARELGDALSAGQLELHSFLETRSARTEDPARVLLFIDQWEELYTQCTDAALRVRFIDALLKACGRATVSALLTVRGDFFDDVLEHRRLADTLQDGVINIGPMTADELRQCIEGPAAKVGLRFEAGLSQRILEDAHRGAGTLPLLEFVLTQLWEGRRGDTLVHSAYEAMGEMRGAIAQRAELEFGNLDRSDQERLRDIMLQLVRSGPNIADTRRIATRVDMGDEAWPIVLRMAEARLLVAGRDDVTEEEVVEVAHEALIHHWERLRAWLDEDREFLLWRQRLSAAIEQFELWGNAALLRGALLIEARRWRGIRFHRLSTSEREFITRSDREARRFLLSRLGYLAALAALVIAVGVATLVLVKVLRDKVREQDIRIVNAAAAATDPLTAALLIAELDPRREPPSGARIARDVASRPIPIAVLDAGEGGLKAAISPDGARVLTGYENGLVVLWPADGSATGVTQHTSSGAIDRVAFSRDGVHGMSVSAAGDVRVWRVDGGVDVRPWGGSGHPDRVRQAVFGADGHSVITASADGVIRIWQLDAASAPRSFRAVSGSPHDVVVSGDGRWLAVAVENVVEVWPVDGAGDPTLLRGHTAIVVSVAFDAMSSRIVTTSNDETVRLWEVVDGRGSIVTETTGAGVRMATFDASGQRLIAGGRDGSISLLSTVTTRLIRWQGHSRPVSATRLSPDGFYVATAGADSAARLWRVGPQNSPYVLAGHGAAVFDVAFSADGSRLITSSMDGTVRVWPAPGRADPLAFRAPSLAAGAALDVGGRSVAIATEDGTAWLWRPGDGEKRALRADGTGLWTVAFDARGERLVTGSWSGNTRVWSVNDGREIATLPGRGSRVAAARFSSDGARIATVYDDGSVRVWHGPAFERWTELASHDDLARDAAFNSDGSLLATASADHTARVWNMAEQAPPAVLRHRGPVTSVAFAPSGSRLVTTSEDSTATVWDAASGAAILALSDHEGAVFHAQFAPDGESVVTASADGTARVWRIGRGGDPIVLRGHRRDVLRARFSHDGKFVVTASTDSAARVFPIDSLAEHTLLAGHSAAVRDAFFTPDGSRVVTISEDGEARVWRVTWSALHEFLTDASSACLDVPRRVQLLREAEAAATRKFQKCERDHGRSAQNSLR